MLLQRGAMIAGRAAISTKSDVEERRRAAGWFSLTLFLA
jgi:hypothetical protein